MNEERTPYGRSERLDLNEMVSIEDLINSLAYTEEAIMNPLDWKEDLTKKEILEHEMKKDGVSHQVLPTDERNARIRCRTKSPISTEA